MQLLPSVSLFSSKFLVIGDFNLPSIDWASNTKQLSDKSFENQFLQTLQEHYLHQHIKNPTRLWANSILEYWREPIKFKSSDSWSIYERGRNRAAKFLHLNRQEVESNVIASVQSCPKRFWKYLRWNQASQSPSSTSFIDPETLSHINGNYVKSQLCNKVVSSSKFIKISLDKISIPLLKNNCQLYGIRPRTEAWITSYISKRTKEVALGDTLSPAMPVISTTRQLPWVGTQLHFYQWFATFCQEFNLNSRMMWKFTN